MCLHIQTGIELEVGAWLSWERRDAVFDRLIDYGTYPARCQARIDAISDEIIITAIDGAADIGHAEGALEVIDEQGMTFSLPAVLGVAGGGLLVGIIIGLLAK